MLPMRLELIISSLQDWCLTTMALEALFGSTFLKVDIRTSGIVKQASLRNPSLRQAFYQAE